MICYPVSSGLVEANGTVWTLNQFVSFQRRRWGYGAVEVGTDFVMVNPNYQPAVLEFVRHIQQNPMW